MEKAFSLDQKETQAYAQLEDEQTKALASFGALTLDRKAARKRLELVQEQQRSFLRSALMHRDVANFVQARIGQGNIYCTLPDPPAEPPQGKANGKIHEGAKPAEPPPAEK
jgi:hypothetical protein